LKNVPRLLLQKTHALTGSTEYRRSLVFA